MVLPPGIICLAISTLTWIHWWSPVASAKALMRSWVISTQSDTPISCPASEATLSKVAVCVMTVLLVNSAGFVGEAAHARLEAVHRAVLDAERGEMLRRAVEIVAVGAERAGGRRDAGGGGV